MKTQTFLVFKWYSSYSALIRFPDITFSDPQDTKSTEKITFKIFLWVWSWLKFYLQQPGTLSPSIWQPVPSSSSVFDPLAQPRSLFIVLNFSLFFSIIIYHFFSCPEQLNRWPCHWVTFTYLGKVTKNGQLFLWAFFGEPHLYDRVIQ